MAKRIKTDKEPLKVVKHVRITETTDKKMASMGFDLREAIDYYITTHEDPRRKLFDDARTLENKIKIKENEIKMLKAQLEEITKKIGVSEEIINNKTLNSYVDAQNIIGDYMGYIKRENDKISLIGFDNYIDSNKHARRRLSNMVAMNGGENKDEYEQEVLKQARELVKKQLK